MAKHPKWYSIPTTMRMTESEYGANITGMNIVFGAVLGFVLAGVEALSDQQFAFVLLLSAAAVVMILYLGSSPYKLFYGGLGAAVVAGMPFLLGHLDVPDIPKLQATLSVWLAITIGLEIMPRLPNGNETEDEN